MKKINENGYSVVVVPIILGVLLLLIAFIFEYGRYVTIRHQLQSAVDSAVLAGASMCKVEYDYSDNEELKVDENGVIVNDMKVVLVETKAKEEAKNYFDKNRSALKLDNVDINEDDIDIKVENNNLQMEIKADIRGVFATALFDKDNRLTITVRAKAEPVDV